MQIGPFQLRNNLIVAPMAGVTDRPFRQLCKRMGAGLAVSEMVASNSLLRGAEKTRRRANHDGEVEPIAVQIAGADPDMGAYSPASIISPAIHGRVMREVIDPAIQGMRSEGSPYTGFLYAGLMIGRDNRVRVLEFNCRLGDPETQPILLRLKSDLLPLIEHALAGTLDDAEAEWDPRVALGVVLASAGYPEAPRTGDVIDGLPAAGDDYRVFHAGTRLDGERVSVSGGRVLCVTALGHNVRTAQKRAYEIVSRIRFDGMVKSNATSRIRTQVRPSVTSIRNGAARSNAVSAR